MLIVDRVLCDCCGQPMGQLYNQSAPSPICCPTSAGGPTSPSAPTANPPNKPPTSSRPANEFPRL